MHDGKTKAQLIKDIEEVKYKIWCFVRDNPQSTTVEIAEAVKVTRARVHHFCNFLTDRGYLESSHKTINKTRHSMYVVTDKDYSSNAEVLELINKKREPTPLEKATRVIRLLDNPLPAPKDEPKKANKVGVGSSMSLFNSY